MQRVRFEDVVVEELSLSDGRSPITPVSQAVVLLRRYARHSATVSSLDPR
jgi:hypothetical protein|eukprot:COSAG01_NODE_23009_length_832_cov_1.184175_2_plen_50_part_00